MNSDDYDFAYEFQRYAESLQRPLRTFRVEFNLGGPAGDGLTTQDEESFYTTSYSATKFSSTSKVTTTRNTTSTNVYDSTDHVYSTTSHENSPTKALGQNPMQFSEIRSLKRVQRNNENVGTDSRQLLDMPGIVEPHTGRILTVGEAIHLRILDVRTGEILLTDGSHVSLEEAVRRGAIDRNLAGNLLKPGAVKDYNGRDLSLLEVIQREILEAENGYEKAEKRIKVTRNDASVDELDESPRNIADAISAGSVDAKTGLYHSKSGKTISIAEAYERGYLIRHESVTIKSNALCLSDAISHGLVDTSGWISDRNSGDKFRLDSAIANQLIDPNVREIVDAKNDAKVTLNEALKLEILNAKTGRYVNQVTKEKITFAEAKNRQLIVKPFTLKDVCDFNLLDKDGRITSPMRREKLSIMQAMNAGVLDENNLKCVTKQKGELITLSEAIADGVILPSESRYRDFVTSEVINIPEAVERGLISSVAQKSIFNIDGFKDPYSGDFVSFNEALSKDILRRKNGEFLLDSGKGNFCTLEIGIREGLVRPEVYEMFNRGVGVHDASGKELSVLDLVYHELIDPKTGYLLDAKAGTTLALDTAIQRKFITPEGALLLSSLLNITLTTETVTKTIKRYVTVRAGSQEPSQQIPLTFTEAVRLGYIDEDRQLFKDPATDKVYSVQQALIYGLLAPDNDADIVPEQSGRKKSKSTITIVTKQVVPEPDPINLKTQELFEKTIDIPVVDNKMYSSTSSKTVVSDFINAERRGIQHQHSTEKELLELPLDGWLLSEAISQKHFDPETGLFLIPGTDRLVSFQECIEMQIINKSSLYVIDPKNGRKITPNRAFEKKVLDATGNYIDGNKTMNMKAAIAAGKIVLEYAMSVDQSNQRLIKVTKKNGQAELVEVSSRLGGTAPQFVELKTLKREVLSPEPLQIAPGAIYDPSTLLVIFTQNGQTENIITAITQGLVDENLVKIVDPQTRAPISVFEAIERRILDPATGSILDSSGQFVDPISAARQGLLIVLGAPLVASEGALHTVRFVVDPRTGEQIPVEVAYERGIVSRDQLSFDSKTSTPSTKSPQREPSTPLGAQRQASRDKSSSPEKESKVVLLQKMRKRIIKPKDALQKGLIDEVTCDILENKTNFTNSDGEIVTISEALELGLIDGSQGRILDPQRGTVMNLEQAVQSGVLDPEGTNQLLIPLAASLSVPKLEEQGLIDQSGVGIVHPETGAQLSMKEAIICEVLDAQSKLSKPNDVTVEKAIEKGLIDEDRSLILTKDKPMNLHEALDVDVFDRKENDKFIEDIPPAGMTFPVAVKRGLVDIKNKEIRHPTTSQVMPIKKAIDDNFLMSIPYPPHADAIQIEEAMERGLIDSEKETMTHPKTGEVISIKEAVEKGILIVKPIPEFVVSHSTGPITSVTETVTSVHTVTTKTIELMQGYALISNNEVQNILTGEIMSVEQAKEQGILREESESKNVLATKQIKQNFLEAVKQGLVDVAEGTYLDPNSGTKIPLQQAISEGILEVEACQPSEEVSQTTVEDFQTIYDEKSQKFRDPKDPSRLVSLNVAMQEGIVDPKALVYDIPTGKVQTLEDGIKAGYIDSETGAVKQEAGPSISITNAAKMGLLAVVGAPVLAGMAIANTIKKVTEKSTKTQQKTEVTTFLPTSPTKKESPEKLIQTGAIPKKDTTKPSSPVIEKPSEPPKKPQVAERRETTPPIPAPRVEEKIEKIIKNGSEDIKISKAETTSFVTESSETTYVTSTTVQKSHMKVTNETVSRVVIEENSPTTTESVTIEDVEMPLTPASEKPDKTKTINLSEESVSISTTNVPIASVPVSDVPSSDPQRVTINISSVTLPNEKPDKVVDSPFTNGVTEFVETVPTSSTSSVITTVTSVRTEKMVSETSQSSSLQKDSLRDEPMAKQPVKKETEQKVVTVTIKEASTPEIPKEFDLNSEKEVPPPLPKQGPPELQKSDVPPISQDASPPTTTSREDILLGKVPEKPVSHTSIEQFLIQEKQAALEDPKTAVLTTTQPKQIGQVTLVTKTHIVDPVPSPVEKPAYDSTDAAFIHRAEPIKLSPDSKDVSKPSDGKILEAVGDAAKTGLMAMVGAPILAGMVVADACKKIAGNLSDKGEPKTPVEVSEKVTVSVTEIKQDRPVVPTTLPIGDAISQKIISPSECRIIVDGEQQSQNVQELLDEEQLSPLDEIKVLDENLVVLQKMKYLIDVNDELSPEKLSELGVYDTELEYFVDPATGQKISFQTLVFDMNVFNPETILVKNFSKNDYETLTAALERPLLDKHTGHMVDPKTGKKIPFFECIAREWIIRVEPKVEKIEPIENVIDPETGMVFLDDGRQCSIAEAINNGRIDIQSISVRDPVSGEVIPLRMAIELGVVDLKTGTVIDIQTLQEISMEEAFKRGFLVPGSRRPISLEAAVRKGLYDPKSGKLYDSESQNQVDVQKSIEIGLVDPKISLIVDTFNNKTFSLDNAIEDQLVIKETGQIKDTKSNELVSFDVGIEKNLVQTDEVTWSLIDVLQREYYSPKTGKVLNPATAEEMTLQKAVEKKFVELESCLIKDTDKDILVSATIAAKEGLLDTFKGKITKPDMTLDQAFVKGYLISTEKPLSLVDTLLRGLYDPQTGLFQIEEKPLNLEETIAAKLINPNELVILDPKTNSIISTADAIQIKLVDPIGGMIVDPFSGTKQTLLEALDNRILIPQKRKRSLPDAVYRGLYDPKSGQFSNTITREKLSTEGAIRRGILDPESTVVSVSGSVVPFGKAVESGTVDGKRGQVFDAQGNLVDFKEAFDRGLLIEVKKPLRLFEAVVKNVYDESDGKFVDPKTGDKLCFAEVLEEKFIDNESVQIRDSKTGAYKPLDLAQATVSGVIDGKTGRLTYNSQKITLKHAFSVGILTDSQAPISVQRAIHQGLFDDRTGKLLEPKTERRITLLEAMRKFIVNPQLPCYFDEQNEQMLTLSETCRAGLVDRREGVFREPGSNVFVSLGEAMSLGLLVDIESAGFGLYELLAMGFYSVQSRQVIHPVTGRQLSLREACVEDIVSLSSSLVKHPGSGKYVRLNNAITEQLIDDLDGSYILPDKKIDLQEARALGLIVTNRKLLSLELAIRMKLFKQETGRFTDPTSGEYFDLVGAIQNGLIDPSTTVFKNLVTGADVPLNIAIENGDIDITKGRVLDPKSKTSYNFDVAFTRGLLLTVNKPITERAVVKRHDSIEMLGHSPVSVVITKPREMTLDEAMRYGIIDSETAVIRDYQTFKFIPLKVAIENGTVDVFKKTLVDPKALFFVFDQSLTVYQLEPISFDQAVDNKSLDLSTGMLTYTPPPPTHNADGESLSSAEEISVLTLRDASSRGIIDPDSALVKDIAKGKLVRLPEAFRKGLMDANKASVLDTKTSKLCPLQQAYDNGLIVTPKRAFGLIEAINFNLYNPTTGCIVDPFQSNPDIINRKKQTIAEAITMGLIDPTSTVVRDPSTSEIVPLIASISSGLIDPVAGRLIDRNDPKNTYDLVKANEKGYLLPAEQRQAVFEKFNLCEENVNELLKWVASVETKIANVGGPKEKIDELRNQINSLKQIKDEIEGQARPVSSCLEQIRQIVLTGGDVLSAPEVTTLENSGRELRFRVDRASDRTQRLLKRLESGRDELHKLRTELDVFSGWLQTARRTLEDKERSLSDLARLSSQSDSIREFVSDVIGHQADLRFITMAAQKFVDESKEFLVVLNDFRTTLPERLPHVIPLSTAESPIREEVSFVSAQYKDLMHRVNALSDRLSGLGGRQREYQDALEKVNEWLRSVQPRASQILNDPVGADPQTVQEQMNEAKALHNEFMSQGRLVENAQQSLSSLLRSLGSQLSPTEVNALEMPVEEVVDKYNQLLQALGDHCKLLDTALVQSQGVQDALDSLVGWVNQAEDKFKVQFRPASLIKERLQEQVREHRSLLSDLQSHQSSIDSVASSAHHLMNTASNARIAKKVEMKLNDVTVKFEKLLDKAFKRGEFLDDTLQQLNKFSDETTNVEQEVVTLQESLESRELSQLGTEDLARRMIELSRRKDKISPLFDNCVRDGKELVSLRDVTDTGVVRDRVKALESQWRNLDITLEEKAKLSKQKAEQQIAYESLKDQVLSWLASIEARTNSLAPVAVDLDIIRQQVEELKPIVKDYKDYASTIDKVNDLGAQYDALIRPESPGRKRSAYSPIKRVSPLRRMSGDARSPSPTKGGVLSPLSPGSSGFGSRRSSQDGFQLSELSPIQQQLSEINNRYSLIGVRLNDRQNELDSLTDEIRKHNESLKNLSSFLDRIQRQVPKDSIANKEEAERSTKQARKILEDMYEKQSLLDSTKAQIKDLLRRKPDVPGAEQLRQEHDNIVEKWRNINDLCKSRINFSEQLRDFLDTHDSLKNWLNSKERMLTVLGPISSDPRMVQSQVQQVQVLREEFRSQQPQLNHLQEIGHEVLDHLKESSPEGQSVSKKLHEVQSKWDDLVGRLDERANSLGGAADSSKEFDAAIGRLRDALINISDNLDALPLDGDSQENLRKIENLERQLEGQRPLLADAEQSAAALCNILGDPASRADVNGRVAALEKQYQALQKKLDTKKAETESSLRDGRQFAESCSKTLGWLSGELANLTDRLLVSAHKPTLQHQIDTHEPIYREVMAREHEVIMLINKGKDLSSRPGATQDRGVQRDLERIQQQWDKLRRDAVDRHTRLQTCMEHCKKYSQSSETFLSWLRGAEDKLADLRPGVLNKAQLELRLRELQAFRSEVWKKTGEYENTKGLGDTFLASCDVDKDPIKAELQDMKERWEKLNNDLLSRAQEIETCSRRLGDFNDELRNLDHSVGRCEDRLAAHDALGGAAKDAKLLDRVKAIKEEVSNLKKPLQSLRALAKDISSEARAAGGDADHLVDEVDGVDDRISELLSRLNDRCGELQSAATAVSQFNEQVKNLGIDLTELENVVENLSPPAREIKVVQAQIDEVSGLQDKLDRMADQLGAVERSSEVLVDSGFSPDTVQTREQVASLKKTLARLENRTRDHEDTLQVALKDLTKFYDIQSGVLDDIKDLSDELKRMKPVSSELEQIRIQQEDFRRFRDRTVEPLSHNVDEVNQCGRDLVRSASSGVSTNAIEKDLEKLNDRWNDLKERLNERDRRLDVALLQSGKFQEALDGLSKWLGDTEEMVANQKPPSADYKVVKAQLQEQKFLKKMLLDRQNSMSSLFNLGQEVAGNCDSSEKAGIERQLKELMNRFDALTDSAQQREEDLEQAMEVAKHFHDKFTPLNQWLDNSERAIKNMELVPTDEEKIQQRIREHAHLHDEIIAKKPDFSELADVAGQLMHLVSDEEAVGLGEKVRVITERYTTLVDASDNVGQLLAESRQGLRHLVLTYQDLVAWMENMEKQLQRFRVVPVHTEKLLEQMDHLLELNESIANHAPNVESTVEAGSELMKHISNDEALQLKDKLDSLQRRYGELTNKGGDHLKNAQNALPLVQQFHDSHSRLIDWMQGAESALSTSEPRQNDILRLEAELADMRPVVDTVNLVGPQLCQISPGEGAATIESLVTRDNRRFDSIVEQIQRKAERLHLSNQRAKEVTGDIDELLEWFRDMDASLREAELPAMEPKLVRTQLQEHRSINDDISSQKGRVRDVTAGAKKVLRESPQNENTSALREKLEDLKEVVDTVVQLCGERLSVLEQALPLSEHFADSHNGLAVWLDDMEQQISMLSMPALRPDQITAQQDKNERLVQSIAEHKPLLDKLNKTGEALGAIVSEDDGSKINEILDSDNSRYAALRTELRERQQALENALQESSQFSDKLEGMLRALANTCEQVNHLDAVSALPQKIREQIDDNSAIADDLDKRTEAFAAVQRAANDVIAKAGNKSDPAVRDIKKKLEKLNSLWNDVQQATKKRGNSLEDVLKVAEKFWKQLNAIMKTLKDLEETLSSQEPAAAQPQDIKKQQVALQEIRHEIDQTKPEVEEVRRTGNNLMSLCGEPDKPEVKKHIEDLDNAWDNITALYARREENLIDAMEKAMEFHETLQNLLKFLTKAEERFGGLGAIGSDIDAVKKQIEQLKRFKDEVDPHMVEVEALNRQASELTERTSPEQAASIKEPLATVNRRWENLLRGMVERQKQLEHALLHLGQFQHALNELLVWIDKTDKTLDQLKPIPGDPQLLEVELAKLKVLANDIQAHQSSVDTLIDAGRRLIESEKGSVEASATQEKLRKLNDEWRSLIQKSSDRQHELEEALREAQGFIAEVQDILGWLGDVDGVIGTSKPVGGLPETATEQLERFMEIYNELEENRAKVETIQAQGQDYIKRQNQMKVPSSNLQHTLRTLKQRWDAVISRASDKKIKLEIALKEATEFHDTLQAFVEWLTQAEKQLSSSSAVSRVLETIQVQIEEHKVLQKDVSTHREAMLLLDKKGTHLKYFSQKQDVILIKNLLVSVQHRWERVVSKAAERTRALDHGYKEAREFNDAWSGMLQWLQEVEEILDRLTEEAASSKDPQKIKKHILKLKETHRQLNGKQQQYDGTMRAGKNLMDRAPKSDEPVLNKMLSELKETWTRVWSKSVDRQRKLEEALLLSGQFSDALQELLDWLKKTKSRLSDNGPVHGDFETVSGLCDHHKHLEQDLLKRQAQMQGVMKSGRDLEKSPSNADIAKSLDELQSLWDDVKDATSKRGDRLRQALKDAERLNNGVQALFDWLDHAENKLRYAKNPPDDEKIARDLLEIHTDFMKDLRKRVVQKEETFQLAQEIIDKAYPDAIPIIKNWLQIIQTRWDEISQWAVNREAKLEQHLQSLKDLDENIEDLLAWLNGLESTLLNLEREPLPEEIPPLEKLIEDHKEFMENTARRQVEVDRACKPKQLPPGSRDVRKMSRNAKTPVRGSTHDLREQSPDAGAMRRQSFKGSRDQGLNMRKQSRVTPSRETPDRDRLPHYGPRFSPSHVPEAEFRSPRAKLLWDKWRHVWLLAWERQRRLHEHLVYLQDVERVRRFSWDDWRKRFLKYMNHKKSRLTDLFRKMDKDNNGLIPREVFIDGILSTKFDTSRMEMGAVADLFDRNGEGLIDWQEFIAALRPDWQERKPANDSDKIHDEVKRLVMLCTCRQKFRVFQVGEGKYRFGDSQKLRLVRILRSTVMVRVGGGWVALDEFLQKNDPCRADEHLAELMPIFERLRAQEQIPCAYPLHMGAGGTVFVRSNNSRSVPLSPHAPHCHPSTHWVRERTNRSIPMSRPSRSSLSASTPDSLSDNEGGLTGPSGRYTPSRKVSYAPRTGMTPGGSRAGSKPNSRPASRQGSKPPSRHGSTLSLDSTDETTPSRIPQRRQPVAASTPTSTAQRPSRLSVTPATSRTNGVSTLTRKTASGSASPAPTSNGGMSRSSSIPTLTGFGFRYSRPSRIPIRQVSTDKSFPSPSSNSSSTTNSYNLSSLGKNLSGSSTPSGMQTPRKGSTDPTSASARAAEARKSRGTTPINQREPFRL
ncbi:uncharacterized protein LOC129942467 isoform X23 [Eupeodes corollae]|uniref:uncharacterized protein LOC129942467 isoform X23 n=1 Tax=Eupeodes corollae TaxID=290404 RepID=UPI002492688D|nr:uncharacterized protein LOC129942467 isoform X23 [Eupeodes corollae]XP_055907400.1 uncharacterized protein LOC129942467 isoform X23 [Eupeodes corollae]